MICSAWPHGAPPPTSLGSSMRCLYGLRCSKPPGWLTCDCRLARGLARDLLLGCDPLGRNKYLIDFLASPPAPTLAGRGARTARLVQDRLEPDRAQEASLVMVVGGVLGTFGESGHALTGILEQFPERLGRDQLSLGVLDPRARHVGFVGVLAGLFHGRPEGLAPGRDLLLELLRELHVLLCCVCARHTTVLGRSRSSGRVEISEAGRDHAPLAPKALAGPTETKRATRGLGGERVVGRRLPGPQIWPTTVLRRDKRATVLADGDRGLRLGLPLRLRLPLRGLDRRRRVGPRPRRRQRHT